MKYAILVVDLPFEGKGGRPPSPEACKAMTAIDSAVASQTGVRRLAGNVLQVPLGPCSQSLLLLSRLAGEIPFPHSLLIVDQEPEWMASEVSEPRIEIL
jgi:hypothetical protein